MLIITMSDFVHLVCGATLIMDPFYEARLYAVMMYEMKHLPKIHMAY